MSDTAFTDALDAYLIARDRVVAYDAHGDRCTYTLLALNRSMNDARRALNDAVNPAMPGLRFSEHEFGKHPAHMPP